MPDWIVHIAVPYIICRLLYFRYPVFNSGNTVIAMVGALLPDIVKIVMIFQFYSIFINDYILVLHTPLASIIIAGIISLFFEDKKLAFAFLTLGVITHYLLDLLLIHIGEGYYLLFPFSWDIFHLNLISPDNYYITGIVLILSFLLFFGGRIITKRSKKAN